MVCEGRILNYTEQSALDARINLASLISDDILALENIQLSAWENCEVKHISAEDFEEDYHSRHLNDVGIPFVENLDLIRFKDNLDSLENILQSPGSAYLGADEKWFGSANYMKFWLYEFFSLYIKKKHVNLHYFFTLLLSDFKSYISLFLQLNNFANMKKLIWEKSRVFWLVWFTNMYNNFKNNINPISEIEFCTSKSWKQK